MRYSILIIAVVCLGFSAPNTLAQTPGTNNASQTDTKARNGFDCPALVPQTPSADRIANARKCFQQGLELMESRQLTQAAEIFRRALQFDPEYADAYAALGRTYFKLREWQKAIENLNRATSLKSKQREENESALTKVPVAETQPLPKPSPVNVTNNSSNENKVNPPPISFPQNRAATIEVNKSLPPIPTPSKEQSTVPLTKNNSSAGNDTAQLKQLPKEPEKQSIDGPTQPPSQPQPGSIQPGTSSNAPQLKAVEAEVKTVAAPTPAAGKNSALPEQTPVSAPVAMTVTPAPIMKETAGPAVSSIPQIEDLPLTKIYRVGPNDVLDVRLNDSGQQSTLYTVTATGLLEHPLFNEPMSVAGLTVEEIGTRIDEDLRKRAIIEDPKAVVGVRDYGSHAVLVSGLVKDAGTKFLRREAIPLYVVVADAQPLPEAAKVSVVRNESNQIYEIDLNQAADMTFLVRSGDVVTLGPDTTQFVYIGGEIKFPGEKTFRRGLTLMQVILSAGGVGPKAKIAEISRDDGNGFLVPTQFKLKEIASGKAIDPILKPGDRISILR